MSLAPLNERTETPVSPISTSGSKHSSLTLAITRIKSEIPGYLQGNLDASHVISELVESIQYFPPGSITLELQKFLVVLKTSKNHETSRADIENAADAALQSLLMSSPRNRSKSSPSSINTSETPFSPLTTSHSKRHNLITWLERVKYLASISQTNNQDGTNELISLIDVINSITKEELPPQVEEVLEILKQIQSGKYHSAPALLEDLASKALESLPPDDLTDPSRIPSFGRSSSKLDKIHESDETEDLFEEIDPELLKNIIIDSKS